MHLNIFIYFMHLLILFVLQNLDMKPMHNAWMRLTNAWMHLIIFIIFGTLAMQTYITDASTNILKSTHVNMFIFLSRYASTPSSTNLILYNSLMEMFIDACFFPPNYYYKGCDQPWCILVIHRISLY